MQQRKELEALAAFGERLASDLATAAARYHVKSDQRDILGYESATVQAYVAWIERALPVPEHLRESVLLGAWGRGHAWDGELDLVRRASEFYRELRAWGVSTHAARPP
ncbi:MAG TPA: hypothetical protein VI197_30250 [Polyangiaceae bacterium]